jgi:putative ABC transport system permease protein
VNTWTGWRTALRVARREARRSKGRSALVMAMIGLPVAALAFAAVTVDMFRLTPMEKLDRTAGVADAVVLWAGSGPVRQDPTSLMFAHEAPFKGEASARPEDTVRAMLPPGSRLLPDLSFTVSVHTSNGVGDLAARALDVTDPMARGTAFIRSGRAPHGAGEVALSSGAAARTGAGVGGTLRLLGDERFRVVGIVEFPDDLGQVALFDPVHLPSGDAAPGPARRWLVDTPAPLRWSDVQRLNAQGVVALSRDVVRHPPARGEFTPLAPPGQFTPLALPGRFAQPATLSFGVLIGGAAVLEIILLAGPAFAVGARRRQRDLALRAANGATAAHLRRVVLADGVVLGAAGALAGLAVGVVTALAGRGLLEEYLAHSRAGGYRVYPLALAGIVAFAITTALLAALVPAFIAARQDVVAALAGRRGVTRSRKRWLVLGAALTALGVVISGAGAVRISSNLILAGLIVGELGLVLCTPALVGLIARLARGLPLSPRIALRDTARNRAAAAPAISAVMAAVAGSIALGVYQGSSDLRHQHEYRPMLPPGYVSVSLAQKSSSDPSAAGAQADTAARVLRETLPTRDVAPAPWASCATSGPGDGCMINMAVPADRLCPYTDVLYQRPLTAAERAAADRDPRCATAEARQPFPSGGPFLVDDGTHLATLTGASGEELSRAAATLRAGGVVVFDALPVVDGSVTIDVRRVPGDSYDPAKLLQQQPESSVAARAYVLHGGTSSGSAVISPAAAQRAGLRQVVSNVYASTTRTPTQAELDRLSAALSRLGRNLPVYVEQGPPQDANVVLIVLATAAAVIALGAAGIATGLAAADSRPDLATLAAVGASPAVRRRLSLSQSGVIAGLGSLLGAGAGFGAAAAVLFALNQRYVGSWPAPPPYPIVVPWLNLAAALLVVPAIAMLGAGLLTRSRLPVERRL